MSGIIVALDLPGLTEARAMARSLVDEVDGFKVGLELLTAEGPVAISHVAALGKPVFADVKLHDIPNTVERACANLAETGARWVTAHAGGGVDMLRAAVSGMGGGGVLAVTVLTSIVVTEPEGIGEQVMSMAAMAASAGVEGVVCSPLEAAGVKPLGLKVFTPGIRLTGGDAHDQRRVATPQEAAAAGADYLIVGRPVTRAVDPVAAVREIATLIAGVGV